MSGFSLFITRARRPTKALRARSLSAMRGKVHGSRPGGHSRIRNSDNGIVKTRKLGSSGLDVSPLMLGGNVFGWTVDEAASFPILDAFVDAGLNFIDTAD